jgi:hypothetical protein
MKHANVQDSVVRTSLGGKWDVETVPWNIRYDDVTAGNMVRSVGGNNFIRCRLIPQECSQHRADVTQAMDIPRSSPMDGVNNFRIDPHTDHQEYSPTIDDRGVKDFDVTFLDNLSQTVPTTANPQIFCQQVFGPQRKHGDRNTGMAIDQIGHSSVTASRDDTANDALSRLFCQIAIQLRTTGKHSHAKSRLAQMA